MGNIFADTQIYECAVGQWGKSGVSMRNEQEECNAAMRAGQPVRFCQPCRFVGGLAAGGMRQCDKD